MAWHDVFRDLAALGWKPPRRVCRTPGCGETAAKWGSFCTVACSHKWSRIRRRAMKRSRA